MSNIERVCIIDDDPIHILITRKVIEKCNKNIDFTVYKNGKQAYEQLRQNMGNLQLMPQLLLLDLHMPVWDGWQFLDEFLKLNGTDAIKVFLLTSSENPEDLLRAKELHLQDRYLIKPLQVERITEIFQTL